MLVYLYMCFKDNYFGLGIFEQVLCGAKSCSLLKWVFMKKVTFDKFSHLRREFEMSEGPF